MIAFIINGAFGFVAGVQPGASKLRHRIGRLGSTIGLYARQSDRRDEQTRREHDAEGLLHRVRQGHRRPSDHGPGQDVAPGALHVQPLFPGAGHQELLRTRRPAVLRTGLPQPVLAEMRLLQRAHTGRKDFFFLGGEGGSVNAYVEFDGFFYIYFIFNVPAEMRDGPGQDMAHGTLFLRAVRQTVRRRRFPRTGRPAVLPGRLLRHVRPEMRGMLPAHNGELRVGPVHPMAFQLLRVPGKRAVPRIAQIINIYIYIYMSHVFLSCVLLLFFQRCVVAFVFV